MKFNIENVHTTVNAEECEPYTVGYFSNDLESLKRAVEESQINMRTVYDQLDGIFEPRFERRFSCSCGAFALFYPTDKVFDSMKC